MLIDLKKTSMVNPFKRKKNTLYDIGETVVFKYVRKRKWFK